MLRVQALLELAHYHSNGWRAEAASNASAAVREENKAGRRPTPHSLSAYGFFEVFISMRSGVPTRLNSLRKRPSRNRLYASVTWSSELPCTTITGGFIPPWCA